MTQLFLLFSHDLTVEQKTEAENTLQIKKIIKLPKDLQQIWSTVIPYGELDIEVLKEITGWIEENSDKDDFVLVQGEYGATFYLVDFCFKNSLIPIYASSKRVYKETKNENGTIKREHIFDHVNFRRYIIGNKNG